MYSPGLELMTPESRGRRSNHFAMEDSRFGKSIFPIYRQSISIINFNTDKTGSRQWDRTLCRSAYIVKTRGVPWKKNVETVKTS